jgi:hypothetical protein
MCAKGLDLLAAFNRAAIAYSESVSQMNRRIGISPPWEFESLRLDSEAARRNAELARQALEAHQREHHCIGQYEDVTQWYR